MSAGVSAPFDQQTSLPQERHIHHLMFKSYAEATKDGTEKLGERPLCGEDGDLQRPNLNGSAMDSGPRQNLDEDRVICDDKPAGQKGEKSTSINLGESYEADLRHDAESALMRQGRPQKRQDVTDSKLASGRRAGAGWQKSA